MIKMCARLLELLNGVIEAAQFQAQILANICKLLKNK